MATTTTNFGLRKPAATDTVNVVTDIADNMDLLDDHRHTGTTDGLQIQTAGLVDDAVTAAKIADDVVTTAHLGVQVPALVGRQGGSATAWGTTGTTDYTSALNPRIQVGVFTYDSGGGLTTITFPVAFSNTPVVILTPTGGAQMASADTTTATTVAISVYTHAGALVGNTTVNWLAIGPE